jgi:hypothetical protein
METTTATRSPLTSLRTCHQFLISYFSARARAFKEASDGCESVGSKANPAAPRQSGTDGALDYRVELDYDVIFQLPDIEEKNKDASPI